LWVFGSWIQLLLDWAGMAKWVDGERPALI
jgi:hypothetical protein